MQSSHLRLIDINSRIVFATLFIRPKLFLKIFLYSTPVLKIDNYRKFVCRYDCIFENSKTMYLNRCSKKIDFNR